MRKIVFPEECEKHFELQCNKDYSLYTSMPEIKNIDKYLKVINPKSVIDIGAGIGRASVYIHHRYHWDDTVFYFLDGNGGDVQLDSIRTGLKDYYNSFDSAKIFCEKNGLDIVQLNAQDDWKKKLIEPVDLIYSFLAIGFHWPIDFYMNDIHAVSKRGALIIFGIRGIEYKQWIENQINNVNKIKYEMVDLILNKSSDRDSVLIFKKL